MTQLSARELAVLDFERSWWVESSSRGKQVAIRERLNISPALYYAVLGRLVDSPGAYDYDPLVVCRLRRRRATRRALDAGATPRERRPR